MSDRRDNLGQVAGQIPVDQTNLDTRFDNVQDVLKEVREKLIMRPTFTVTSLNGVLQLTTASLTTQIIEGSGTGFKIDLPNATTLFEGEEYFIFNSSSQSIVLRDFGDNVLLTIAPQDSAVVKLEDNSTSNGTWIIINNSSVASGVQAFTVTQSALFTVSNPADTLVTGLTATPGSGTYGIWYSANILISQNNRIAECVLYKAGIAEENTRRDVQGVGANFRSNQQTLGIISVNGSQSIAARINVSGGSITLNGRALLLIRLGAES